MKYNWKMFWILLVLTCTVPLLLPQNEVAAMISVSYALITTCSLVMTCNWQNNEGTAERWFGLTAVAASAYFVNWLICDTIRLEAEMNRLGF